MIVPLHQWGNDHWLPETTSMPKQLIGIKKTGLAVLCAGLLLANLTPISGWGAGHSAALAVVPAVAPVTITLDVKNEPLRSVLGKITKLTRWKIKAPDRWMEKPVTQTLNKVELAEGLRAVFTNAGVENLFLMYDEDRKVVTLFDTEKAQKQSADRLSTQVQPPVAAANEPDPRLQNAARDAAPRPARPPRRIRRQSSEDE